MCLWLGLASAGSAPEALRKREALLFASYEGVLYAPGTDRSEVLFRVTAWASEDGRHRMTRFRGADGAVLATEDLWLREGSFERYSIEHHGAGRSGEIVRDGDRVRFRWSEDGEVESRDEPFRPPLLVPPRLPSFIRSQWPALMRGERLRVRLGVPYARRTIGFELARRVGEGGAPEREGREVIRMSPTSFLIRRIVRPIELAFTPDGETVLEVSGRAPALVPTDDGWQRTEIEGLYRKVGP